VKVVLDTSVLAAAFYQPARGPAFSRDVYDYLTRSATLYVSTYILEEFQRACLRKFRWSYRKIREAEAVIREDALIEDDSRLSSAQHPAALRDRNDAPILALALTVQADYLLTWDKDLLSLEKVKRVRILSPRDFWDALES
jgi:uncharacterized protein